MEIYLDWEKASLKYDKYWYKKNWEKMDYYSYRMQKFAKTKKQLLKSHFALMDTQRFGTEKGYFIAKYID